MLAAAVTAFRTLVTTIQGTNDPSNQLNHVVGSMGDMATVFEQITTAAAATEQQHELMTQHKPADCYQQPVAATDKPTGDDQQPAQQQQPANH